MSDVLVVALVGESPGVLTELLWHLVVAEGHRVAAVEVWTNDRGRDRLRRVGPTLFHTLAAQLGPLATAVPSFDPRFRVYDDPARAVAPGYTVLVPRGRDGQNLEDVASAAEARVFGAWAHRRFAVVSEDPRPIVCSIAGGRKGMSALTHSAFTLYAREGDRLVHVVLNPVVEAMVRRAEYACPTPLPGIALTDQVRVFDVPFFPVRDYADPQRRRSATDLVAAMRRALAEATDVPPPRIWARAMARDRVEILIGGRSVVCSRPYAAAWWLCAIAGEPVGPSTLMRRAALRLGHGIRDPASIERTLRNLRGRFEAAAGLEPALLALAPKRVGLSWQVDVDPSLMGDVAAMASVMFPLETNPASDGDARK